MESKNKILVITTEHCESCTIVVDRLKEILETEFYKDKFQLEVKDKTEVGKQFCKTNRITDFPTALFYKDDEFVFKFTGNYPTIIITTWIDNFLTYS